MKAKITRPDGTVIEAEGTPEELRDLASPAPLPAAPPLPVFNPPGQITWQPVPYIYSPQVTIPEPTCCCPLGDPSYKPGTPILWGGHCPKHSTVVSVHTMGYIVPAGESTGVGQISTTGQNSNFIYTSSSLQ